MLSGRGGFGEVFGCRKVDTGKMYAMKCLDIKRIRLKNGEALALNERKMLQAVSEVTYSPLSLSDLSEYLNGPNMN